MKKLHWNTIAEVGAVLLAVLCLITAYISSNQAITSYPLPQTVSGEYSQNGGPWKPLNEHTWISARDGDVVLRGHLSYDSWALYFYRNHIGVSMWVNGELLVETSQMETAFPLPSSMCGREWYGMSGFRITTEDEIEILLHNPHRFGNESAYMDFLSTLCNANVENLQKWLVQYSWPFEVVGILLIMVSLMVIGVALTTRLLHLPAGEKLLRYGALSFFAGGYFILDMIDISLRCDRIVFYTYGCRLCMMLVALLLFFLTADCLMGKCRKIGEAIAMGMAGVDTILILLVMMGKMLLMDTYPIWAVTHAAAALLMIGCCVVEFRPAMERKQKQLISCLVMMIATLMDLAGVKRSIYSHASCTKIVFLVLAVIYLARSIKYIVMDHQLSMKAQKLEEELDESRISIMLSQIQPHFLYNMLTSIYQLCAVSPAQAQQAIGAFSKYLRGNLDFLEQRGSVPIEDELNHVKTYLGLEKIRFGDRLKVVYQMESKSFSIPQMTVQPLVENAVKHGISKRRTGGTIIITTRETPNAYCISVADNGIGFDMETPKQDGEHHIGLKNVQSRLKTMCGGELTVTSMVGLGTTARITIPKGDDTL